MKKILYILIIALTVILTGCELDLGEEEKIEFSVNDGESWNYENNEIDFDIINTQYNKDIPGMTFFYAFTYTELLDKIDEYQEAKSFSYYYPDDAFWNTMMNTYNSNYFEEYILLFYFKYEPNVSRNYVHSVSKSNGTLVLNVNRFEGMCTALSSWCEIVTVKKTDAEGIKKIRVLVNTIQEKQESLTLYINPDFYRKAYVEGFFKDDFIGVNNIKEVSTYASNFILEFNLLTTDEQLIALIIEEMNFHDLVISASWDYRGDHHNIIRIYLKTICYDDFLEQKFNKNDFTNSEYIDKIIYRVKPHMPWIVIKMDKKGMVYANEMLEEIKKLEFNFIDISNFS